jgi:hypothetical protein
MTDESSTNTQIKNNVDNENVTNDDTDIIEKPKPNRNSIIIKVVFVVCLAYVVLTEFVFKEEPTLQEVIATPHKKAKGSAAVAEKTAEVVTEQAKLPETLPESNNKVETPKTSLTPIETPPVEEIKLTKKTDDTTPEAPPIENIPLAADKEFNKTINQLIDKEEGVASKPIDKKIEPSIETKKDEIKEVKVESPKENKLKEKQIEKPEKEITLKDKIVDEHVYIEPPSYLVGGRGLVYNCKDHFWACLDKTSYVQCNKNMKWNNENDKKSECSVVNVYSSNEDCEKIQKYNITLGQPTTFCKD